MKNKKKTSYIIKDWLGSFSFALPALFFYVVFVMVPILGTIQISLHRWDGASPTMEFVGLQHYIAIFKDPIFYTAIKNNIIWILFTIFVPVTLGLFLALLITRKSVKGKLLYRLVYFIPNIVSLVAVGIVWGWIYNPEFGILTKLLSFLGAGRVDFLGSENLVIWSLVVAGSWTAFGFNMVVFLAALQGVDKSQLEAAYLEGANFWQTIWYITIPNIKGTITLLVLNSLVGSFKVFDIIWIMTGAGPYHSSEVLSTYMYNTTFNLNNYGYGSAIAVVLALFISVCSLVYMRQMEKED